MQQELPDSFLTAVIRDYKIPLIFGSISISCIIFAFILLFKSISVQEPIKITSNSEAQSDSQIIVDVEGAVVNPGVYKMDMGMRVDDVLKKAGGFTSDADLETVSKYLNRASQLSDGAKIFIPRQGEESKSMTSHNEVYATTGNKIDDFSLISAPDSSSQNNLISSISNALISINNSEQLDLESLNGVGPVTAKKIIDNRPYASLMELVEKKVVGQKLFDKIKDQISL